MESENTSIAIILRVVYLLVDEIDNDIFIDFLYAYNFQHLLLPQAVQATNQLPPLKTRLPLKTPFLLEERAHPPQSS